MHQHRLEQRQVGGEGERADVQQRIVGQAAVGAHPHAVAAVVARTVLALHPGRVVDVAQVERPREPLHTAPPPRRSPRTARASVGRSSGRGTSGIARLVVDAALGQLERRRQHEDRLAVLDGRDPPDRERPPVAQAVDRVDDRHRGIAGTDEVRVQRVHRRGPASTVRPAATSACPATWPPKTRCSDTLGLRPRKMFSSIGSRSSSRTSPSTTDWPDPACGYGARLSGHS